MREVGDDLCQAVIEVITAAREAYSFDLAVRLLKVAQYAKLFIGDSEQQLQITTAYDSAREELRARHTIAVGGPGIFFSGYRFTKTEFKDLAK